MKVSTSSVAGLTSAIIAANNVALRLPDGICAETLEQCMKMSGRSQILEW